jgi:hypothetical protein
VHSIVPAEQTVSPMRARSSGCQDLPVPALMRHTHVIELKRPQVSSVALYASLGVLCAMLGSACAAPATPLSATSSTASGSGSHIAGDVVDTLTRNGLQPGRPVDTTATDCPKIGCVQSITTDRMQVLSFRTSGAAQIYAADHSMRQVMTVVVAFAPTVRAEDCQAYWAAISRLMS